MTEDIFYQRLAALGIEQEDIQEIFARSSGPGGQNVNKVSTSVTLKCEKRGVVVTAQDTRSQARNRELARERFIGRLEEERRRETSLRRAETERERRRRRPRPRGLKERILKTKRIRAQTKKGRSRPGEDS